MAGTPDRRDASVDPLLEVHERRRGRRPGDAYVRIARPFDDTFRRGPDGGLVATDRTILERRGWKRGLRRFRTWLIGRPISSELESNERLTKLKALAVFSSDNISSSAYATEEMMRILVLAGLGALSLTMPLAVVICVVLAIVVVSYRQTIRAYPEGASAYLVASDNFNPRVGLVAAAALLVDYVLTVAVSVSAGVAAITSIAPVLYPERVLLAVAIVAVLMVGNLRGVRESGSIFMAPTYLYLVTVAGLIGYGVFRSLTGEGLGTFDAPASWLESEDVGSAGVLTSFLVLRAFSSGAVALTGVEAISDGVTAFKRPEWQNARTTLTVAAAIFATVFLGISWLAAAIEVVPDPTEQQTVLALVARHVTGDGPYLVLLQVATAAILTVAANTSFADFPRLSYFLARDGFMPRQFAFRGERLAFTTGIIVLSAMAGILLVAFGASVTALIPLYTLGVFLAFTLSQAGMVRRWWHRREPGWRNGVVINGLGAVTTGVIAVIVIESKFLTGAWMVVVAIPMLVAVLLAIRHHYRALDAELALDRIDPDAEIAERPIVIVPIARLDRPARRAIAFANSISVEAVAVHVTNEPADAAVMRERWPWWAGSTELVIVESPYRALIGPLLAYMDALQQQAPERPILVVLPEFTARHWWENLLHNQTALRLKLRLYRRPNTIVADVPYHASR